MPKKKTNRAAMKRFRLTGRGKIRRHKANKGHLATHKTPKRKRHLRQGTLVSDADHGRIKKLLEA